MEYIIRKYRDRDREAVRKICLDTAVLGEPVDVLFDDRDIAADILISYYTDFEPGSCFVAVSGEKVIGYLAGCVDFSRRRRAMLLSIIPRVLARAASRSVLFRKKTFLLGKSFAPALIRGEFRRPDFSIDYPASLHINVETGFRGRGVGPGLLDEYVNYLRVKKIKGVMLETKSRKAAKFFESAGFKVLYSHRISYLQYCGCADATLFVMGKKIESDAAHANLMLH